MYSDVIYRSLIIYNHLSEIFLYICLIDLLSERHKSLSNVDVETIKKHDRRTSYKNIKNVFEPNYTRFLLVKFGTDLIPHPSLCNGVHWDIIHVNIAVTFRGRQKVLKNISLEQNPSERVTRDVKRRDILWYIAYTTRRDEKSTATRSWRPHNRDLYCKHINLTSICQRGRFSFGNIAMCHNHRERQPRRLTTLKPQPLLNLTLTIHIS